MSPDLNFRQKKGASRASASPVHACIDSRKLLPAGQTTVSIDHAGQRYILRVTRENKLILTK